MKILPSLRPVLLGLAGLAAFLSPIAGAEETPPPTAEAVERFAAYAEEAAADWRVPGMAVAVVADGEIVLARGFGVRELGSEAPVDEHTLFAIGSTTKAMTAALLGQLVEAGELGWDDPVAGHWPGFRLHDPWVTREVTVRDLLTHRAGLGNADLLWYGTGRTSEEILDKLERIEPAYSLRGGYVYQNILYAAAGELAARIAGTSWEELLERRLLEPLGMARTAPTLAVARRRDNIASPHDRIDDELVAIENEPVDPVAPAGSVWSSAAEMARWVRMLLAEGVAGDGARVLAEATVAELFTPQHLIRREAFYPTARLTDPHWISYGLGWFQQDYHGRQVQFHTGSIDGMSAIVGLVPEEELGVVVLANREDAELRHALLWRAIDLFTGVPSERDWSAELLDLYGARETEARALRSIDDVRRIPGTAPTLALARYAGTYRHPLYDEIEVRIEDDSLHLDAGPRRTARLEHWHYDTFRAHWDRAWQGTNQVTFALGHDGRPARLTLGGLEFERSAIAEAGPPPE